MKKILLLGGSSFIGFSIFKNLAQKNDVIATYNKNKPAVKGNWEKVDVTSAEKLLAFLNKQKPDVIINCVAHSNVDDCEKDRILCKKMNLLPTETIAKYCASNPKIKYIFFSSSQVFGGKAAAPYTIRDIPTPINYYGRTKLHCEQLIQKLANYAIIRPSVVYGLPLQFQHRNIFNHIYNSLKEGKEFTAYTDMQRSPCFVEDVALVVKKIIELDKKGLFHAGGETMTIAQFALSVAGFFNFNSNVILQKESTGREAVYKPINSSLDIFHTTKELGIRFRPITEALQEMRGVL